MTRSGPCTHNITRNRLVRLCLVWELVELGDRCAKSWKPTALGVYPLPSLPKKSVWQPCVCTFSRLLLRRQPSRTPQTPTATTPHDTRRSPSPVPSVSFTNKHLLDGLCSWLRARKLVVMCPFSSILSGLSTPKHQQPFSATSSSHRMSYFSCATTCLFQTWTRPHMCLPSREPANLMNIFALFIVHR